jgi:hypothetical protein
LPVSSSNEALEVFSGPERECIQDLSKTIRGLGASEIRALGTHENLQETLKDVGLEFKSIRTHARHVAAQITAGEPFLDKAELMLEYAEEAYLKSYENQKDYKTGYNAFLSDVTDSFVKNAFEKCQAPPSQIWDSVEMRDLAKRSGRTLAIAKGLTAIAYFAAHADERNQQRSMKAKEMKHRWDEASEGFIKHQISGIPSNLTALYENDGQVLTMTVRDRLLAMLNELQR